MIGPKTFPLLLLLLFPGACSGTRPLDAPITVEGRVSVRGNEPFTGVWLETDARNSYVLVLGEAVDGLPINPARYRVTGRVYLDDWNGRPLAHLAVSGMTRLSE